MDSTSTLFVFKANQNHDIFQIKTQLQVYLNF